MKKITISNLSPVTAIEAGTHYEFSEEYKEAAFFAWYRAGRPISKGNRVNKLIDIMPKAENGSKPTFKTLIAWRENYGWIERADAMDAKVSEVLENDAIKERVETLRQLAKDGKTLKEKGLKYLADNDEPFEDNPAAAVRAIVAGSEMEFRYAGQAAVLSTIGQMTDKQIQSEIRKLLSGSENDTEPESEEENDSEYEDAEISEDDAENSEEDSDESNRDFED